MNKQLKNLGYVIMRDQLSSFKLSSLKADAVSLYAHQIKACGIDEGNFEASYKKLPGDVRSNVEIQVNKLFSLARLATEPQILDIAYINDQLFPLLNKFGISAVYNSLPGFFEGFVIYAPMVELTNPDLGLLQVVPGVYSKFVDVIVEPTENPVYQDSDFVSLPLDVGDIAVLDARIIHRFNIPQHIDRLRWMAYFNLIDARKI